jgi:Tfp pilus assembly protein PilZ
MWQSPNQRVRAAANARKRERERLKMPFHIKRVVASVGVQVVGQAEPLKVEVRVILNDFTQKGMGLFSAHRFSSGEDVTIELETPNKIQLKGKIAWCQEYEARGKILTEHSFSYRVGLHFTFASAEEEQAVKTYCADLLQNHHCLAASA